MTRTAPQVAASIRKNVAKFYAGTNTIETFRRLNTNLWKEAETLGINDDVARIIGKR